MSTLTRTTLEVLGRRVAEKGIDATPKQELQTLAAVATNAGLYPAACSVLVDANEPTVARLRAFELVSCALSGVVRDEHVLAA